MSEDYKLINAKTLLCKKKTNLQNALLFFDIYKLQRVFGLGRNFLKKEEEEVASHKVKKHKIKNHVCN